MDPAALGKRGGPIGVQSEVARACVGVQNGDVCSRSGIADAKASSALCFDVSARRGRSRAWALVRTVRWLVDKIKSGQL